MRMNLPYLECVTARGRRYWYYRRAGRRVPITHDAGVRLSKDDTAFLPAYGRIHEGFEISRIAPREGSVQDVVTRYKASPDYNQLAPKTRRDYARFLDALVRQYGDLSIAKMPRDAVIAFRDKYATTPRTANYAVSVVKMLLTYSVDRGYRENNPASRIKALRTGDGHRPWEEVEVEAFRKTWGALTRERVAFELLLNTGQRGQDIPPMMRQHYFRGDISIRQQKTKERLWIPASRDLKEVLDPWLQNHGHLLILPTMSGKAFGIDYFRHTMRDAIRAACCAHQFQ